MQFDPENTIVKLCAQGMMLEGEGKNAEALALFEEAWNKAGDDLEKFIAAHYVARHQPGPAEKLNWDLAALQHALKAEAHNIASMFPSLYLNIAKCYEDLTDAANAVANYNLALSYADHLPGDGYGQMIRKGIAAGLERTKTFIARHE